MVLRRRDLVMGDEPVRPFLERWSHDPRNRKLVAESADWQWIEARLQEGEERWVRFAAHFPDVNERGFVFLTNRHLFLAPKSQTFRYPLTSVIYIGPFREPVKGHGNLLINIETSHGRRSTGVHVLDTKAFADFYPTAVQAITRAWGGDKPPPSYRRSAGTDHARVPTWSLMDGHVADPVEQVAAALFLVCPDQAGDGGEPSGWVPAAFFLTDSHLHLHFDPDQQAPADDDLVVVSVPVEEIQSVVAGSGGRTTVVYDEPTEPLGYVAMPVRAHPDDQTASRFMDALNALLEPRPQG